MTRQRREMNELIESARWWFYELKRLLELFPKEMRERRVIPKWSLKDLVAHFTGWAVHDLEFLAALRIGEEPYREPNIDEFNDRSVQARKNRSWEEVYEEFVTSYLRLLEAYQALPSPLWKKKFRHDQTLTPEENLQEDIEHLGEHLAQIREVLRRIK